MKAGACLFLGSLVLVSSGALAAEWVVEVVDGASPGTGHGTSVAVDSQGRARIAYPSAEHAYMMHAELTGAPYGAHSWDFGAVNEVNPVASAEWPSVAVGQDDRSRVAFHIYGYPPQALWYAEQNDPSWDFPGQEDPPYVDGATSGFGPSLALDQYDHPHISYVHSTDGMHTNSVKFASYNGSSWDTEFIVSGTGGLIATSLALDQRETPRVSWTTHSGLYYAERNDGSWNVIPVPGVSGVWLFSSLVLDGDDLPWIAYVDTATPGPGNAPLKIAHWTGSLWESHHLGETRVGAYETGYAMCVSNDGMPTIAYHSPDGLKFNSWDGQSWMTEAELVDSVGGYGVSLAFDQRSNPWISYSYDGELRLAYLPEPTTLCLLALGGLAAIRRKR